MEDVEASLGLGEADRFVLIGIDTFRVIVGVLVRQDGITSSCSESGRGVHGFCSGEDLKFELLKMYGC